MQHTLKEPLLGAQSERAALNSGRDQTVTQSKFMDEHQENEVQKDGQDGSSVTNYSSDHEDYQEFRNSRNAFSISGQCESEIKFETLCTKLFGLKLEGESSEVGAREYFQSNSKQEFVDKLYQLALVSTKREEFTQWIEEQSGLRFKNDLHVLDRLVTTFQNAETNQKNQPFYSEAHQHYSIEELRKLYPIGHHLKQVTEHLNKKKRKKEQTNSMDLSTIKERTRKLYQKLFDYYDSFKLNQFPTHKEILQLLIEAKQLGYFDEQNLNQLISFREVIYDMFYLIDDDNDNVLRKFTLDDDGDWLDGDLDESVIEIIFDNILDDLDSIQSKLIIASLKRSFGKQLDYHHFQLLLWNVHRFTHFDYIQLHRDIYKQMAGFSCFRSIKQRAVNFKNKLYGIDRKSALSPVLIFLKDFLHLSDIVTDLSLAKTMYDYSREDFTNKEDTKFMNDYNICFVVICLATFGPYLIQYSSYMNLLYHKGIYQRDGQKRKIGCCKKVYLRCQLTAIGLFQIIFMDVLFKFQSLFNLMIVPLGFINQKGQPLSIILKEKLRNVIENLLEMNEFEVDNFKQQNKFTQLIFEDFVMIMLDILLFTRILSVPKVMSKEFKDSMLWMQLLTTSLSIYQASKQLVFQSSALQEGRIEYLLVCLKAKQGWIPFANQLSKGSLKQDINFGQIELKKYSGIFNSNRFGNYEQFNFKFSDFTLKLLTKHIQEARDSQQQIEIQEENQKDKIVKEQIMNYTPKIAFGNSLDYLTVHEFLSFIDTQEEVYVQQNFNFDTVNWSNLINNSKKEFDRIKEQGKPVTDFGKPLLEICINNESHYSNVRAYEQTQGQGQLFEGSLNKGKWQLRELMRRLLVDYECNPNIFESDEKHSLLWRCLYERKIQAFKMICQYSKHEIDANIKNKNQATLYGALMHNMYTINQLNLQLGHLIDYESSVAINDRSQLITPLYYFLDQRLRKEYIPWNQCRLCRNDEKKCRCVMSDIKTSWWLGNIDYNEKDEIKRIKKVTDSPQFIYYFKTKKISVKTEEQVHQLVSLCKDYKENFMVLDPIIHLISLTEQEELKLQYPDTKIRQLIEDDQFKNNIQKAENSTTTDIKYNNVNELIQQYNQVINGQQLKKVNCCFLPVLLSSIIEVASLLDFYSDLIIVRDLGRSTDTAWFAFSLFTILAPYFTVYTSLINQQIKIIRAQNQYSTFSIIKTLVSCITVLPTMLVFLIIIDLFYMAISVIAYPSILPFSFCQIGELMLEKYEQIQSFMLYKTFGLSYMEIEGFRSQRTILQFQLESIPQIIFQIYLLIRLKQLNRDKDGSKIGVSKDDVVFSVYCAFVHVIFELLSIQMESKTSETPFIQYTVTCYNSREKWMPRQSSFQNCNYDDSNQVNCKVIEIDRPGQFCGGKLGYQVGFKFTNESIELLKQLISNMAFSPEQMGIYLTIDECFRDISPRILIDVGKLALGRVYFKYTKEMTMRIQDSIKNDSELMNILEKPRESDNTDAYQSIIMKILLNNQWQLLEILIELQTDIQLDHEMINKTINHSIDNFSYETLSILHSKIRPKQQNLNIVEQFNKKGFYLPQYLEIPTKIDWLKPYLSFIESLYFEPSLIMPTYHQFEHLQIIIKDLKEGRKLETQIRLYAVFGASPQLTHPRSKFFKIVQKHERLNEAQVQKYKDQLAEFIKLYPRVVSLKSNDCQISFNSSFLCRFMVFRKIFFKAFVKKFDNKAFPNMIDMDHLNLSDQIDLQDLKQIEQILIGRKEPMTVSELERLDKIIKILVFDREKVQYMKQSRNLLSPSDQKNAVFEIKLPQEIENFKIPTQVASLRSFTINNLINQDHLSIEFIIQFKHCQLTMLHDINSFVTKSFQQSKSSLTVSRGWPHHAIYNKLKKNFQTDLSIINDKEVIKESVLCDLLQLSKIIETLKNDLQDGVVIQKLNMWTMNQQPKKYNVIFEFYKQIENGQFVQTRK